MAHGGASGLASVKPYTLDDVVAALNEVAPFRLVRQTGVLSDVLVDSPAGKAGIGPGMQILTVNGLRYSPDVIKDAVASTSSSGALRLDVQVDDVVKPMTVDYRGGTREPHLERDSSKPDVLGQILASRAQ